MKKYVLLLVLLNFACSRTKEKIFNGNALGTTYHIVITGEGKPVKQKQVEREIAALNRSLSTYQVASLLSRFNRGEAIVPDEHILYVMGEAGKIYRDTKGLYDPTVGVLVNAWGFGPGKRIRGLENDSVKVDSLRRLVGFDMIYVDGNGRLRKQKPGMFLDFNSIAKGYVIDRIAAFIRSRGYKNFLVELGGEVVASGINEAESRPWRIGIDYPVPGRTSEIAYLELKDKALATSGNYRKFRIDRETGRKFVHTINPKTGYPVVSHLLSASVVAPNCTVADGWATACMAGGPEKAKRWILSKDFLEGVLIYSDSTGQIKVWHSPGLEGKFKEEE